MLIKLKCDIENLLNAYKITLEQDTKQFYALLKNDMGTFKDIKQYNDKTVNKINDVLEILERCEIKEKKNG